MWVCDWCLEDQEDDDVDYEHDGDRVCLDCHRAGDDPDDISFLFDDEDFDDPDDEW